jgi:sensor histidine kinase YesM
VLFLEEVSSLEDQEILIIPPMLIQPILENAIFHGLSPLEDQGQILLKITLHTKTMKIIVKDNGVGRKEAMINKKIKEGNEEYMSKSIPTKILKERIDALNYLYKAKSEFYLEDVITTGIVCDKLGRSFVGYDLKEYYKY